MPDIRMRELTMEYSSGGTVVLQPHTPIKP